MSQYRVNTVAIPWHESIPWHELRGLTYVFTRTAALLMSVQLHFVSEQLLGLLLLHKEDHQERAKVWGDRGQRDGPRSCCCHQSPLPAKGVRVGVGVGVRETALVGKCRMRNGAPVTEGWAVGEAKGGVPAVAPRA